MKLNHRKSSAEQNTTQLHTVSFSCILIFSLFLAYAGEYCDLTRLQLLHYTLILFTEK